jgi:hypothetical protein
VSSSPSRRPTSSTSSSLRYRTSAPTRRLSPVAVCRLSPPAAACRRLRPLVAACRRPPFLDCKYVVEGRTAELQRFRQIAQDATRTRCGAPRSLRCPPCDVASGHRMLRRAWRVSSPSCSMWASSIRTRTREAPQRHNPSSVELPPHAERPPTGGSCVRSHVRP